MKQHQSCHLDGGLFFRSLKVKKKMSFNIVLRILLLKTSIEPRGLVGLSNCRALGFTGAVKQGAPGALYSHIPCHKRMPFSKR